jgi:flagellar hook protein FlgE
MMRSLFSGTSGLRGNQSRIDVIGNNISNVNTNGYKAARSNFRTTILQMLSTGSGPTANRGSINPLQIGLGTGLASVDSDFNQGTTETTSRRGDVAIEGQGFFVLGNGDVKVYTRNGAFNLDQQGNLVALMNGFYVKGWNADFATGDVDQSQPVESLNVPVGGLTVARASTEVKYLGNLNASGLGFAQTTETQGLVTGNPLSGGAQTFTITPQVGAADTVVLPQLQRGGAYTADARTLDFNVMSGLLATDQIDVTLTLAGGATTTVAWTPTVGNYSNQATYVDNFVADWNATAGMPVRAVKEGPTSVRFYDYSPGLGVPVSTGGQGTASSFAFTPTALGTATANTVLALGMRSGVYETFGAAPSPDPEYVALVSADQITTQCAAGNLTAKASTDGSGRLIVESLIPGLDGRLALADAAGSTAINSIYGNPSQLVDVDAYRTSVVVYDTLGAAHTVNLDFNRRGNTRIWEYRATDENGINVIPGGVTSGTIAFSSDGQSQTGTIAIQLQLTNGASSPQSIALDLSDLNQFAGSSTVTPSEQDGVAMGTLENYSISTDGQVIGEFTNGLNRKLAQLALATFNNSGGLTQIGTSMWRESISSGTAQIGTPETGSRGKTVQGALESSNVDLANEFTQLIIGQRGFQANARVITTSDEMLTELTNLKR